MTAVGFEKQVRVSQKAFRLRKLKAVHLATRKTRLGDLNIKDIFDGFSGSSMQASRMANPDDVVYCCHGQSPDHFAGSQGPGD
jgi:hypothetical protein